MTDSDAEKMRILFADTDSVVVLDGCGSLAALFPIILPGWNFRAIESSCEVVQSFLSMRRLDSGYIIESRFFDRPQFLRDEVDAVCAIVAELAWATIEANPEWLCLHCAAAEFGNGLVVFPSVRRAGKSTLSAALGLKGISIFTDDFLAIRINQLKQVNGISGGVGVRMRRPWPMNISGELSMLLSQSEVAASSAYSYHTNKDAMPIQRGIELPIRSFVLLDRQQTGLARIEPTGKREILTAIIGQNFARSQNANRILQVLHYLASHVDGFRLTYSNVEEAASMLIKYFGAVGKFLPPVLPSQIADPALGSMPEFPQDGREIHSDEKLRQAPNVETYLVEGTAFLADGMGYAIHRLDEMSTALWKLLAKPISAKEIEQIFMEAFPDQTRDTIHMDIFALLRRLRASGLIQSKE